MSARTPDNGRYTNPTNKILALGVGVAMIAVGILRLIVIEPQITSWASTGFPSNAGGTLGWAALAFVALLTAGVALTAYSAVSLQRSRLRVTRGTPDSHAA